METIFYLDDYNLICSNLNESFLNGNIKLFKNDKEIDFELSTEDNLLKLSFFDEYEYGDIYKVVHDNKNYDVQLRFIYQTDKFDEDYCPDVNTLGSFYHKNYTTFRTWAPYSEGAYVVINNEPYRMTSLDKGVYEASIKGNLEAFAYHYEVIRNGERYSFKDIFSYSNSKDNKESYVINLKKLKVDKVKIEKIDDQIIYELSVRDFSSDESAPFINKGKFLAFLEEGLKINNQAIGIDYLENLGVSHVQIMPINNYDLDGFDYGWGYNPLDYNTLSWLYVVDEDAYAPIREFRQLVNRLHKANLHVNIDIVFNHIYKIKESPFNNMLPYYFFRYEKDGKVADGSLCGNEIRSEGKFTRDYFCLLVERYIKHFDIDGLRFDLAGLLDIDTINKMYITAKNIKDDFMMYGEGWDMGNVLPRDKKTIIENADKVKDFAFFNGVYRDSLKGSFSEKYTKGYLLGNKTYEEEVKNGLRGSYEFYLNPNQSINYVECHDNYTFFDKVNFFGFNSYDRKNICMTGLSAVLLSCGIPFINAGQEFLRTKQGHNNSYNLSDEINKIDWTLMSSNIECVNYFKELIRFRRKYPVFRNEEVNFSYYYDLLIYAIKDIDIFINPTEYPYVYQNWITYKEILFNDGKKASNLSTFDIPAYSFVIAVKS